MASIIQQNTRYTLMDVIQREAGGVNIWGDSLAQVNEFIPDLLLKESNEKLTNVVVKVTSYGTPAYGRFNAGRTPTKTSVQDQTDKIQLLVDRFVLHDELGDVMENKEFQVSQEIDKKRNSFSIKMTNDLFYGNPQVNLDQMWGLANKFNSLLNRPTIVSAGGSTGNSSIYIMTNDFSSFYGFYPKGMPGGLKYKMRGPDVPIPDENNKVMFAEVHDLSWALGTLLVNERMNARLCNIATGSLTPTGGNYGQGPGADLPDLFRHTLNQRQNIFSLNSTAYLNRTVYDMLDRQCAKLGNHWLTEIYIEDQGLIRRFREVRLRLVEQISNSETTVS
jgi:hypothetical protein